MRKEPLQNSPRAPTEWSPGDIIQVDFKRKRGVVGLYKTADDTYPKNDSEWRYIKSIENGSLLLFIESICVGQYPQGKKNIAVCFYENNVIAVTLSTLMEHSRKI